MVQENPFSRFNKHIFKGIGRFSSATWYYPEDLVMGMGISFNRYFRPGSSIEQAAKEATTATIKVVGGLALGTIAGIGIGLTLGGSAIELSQHFSLLSYSQAVNFDETAILIGSLLGALVGTGLYHASIGRKERHQRENSQRRLRNFFNS